MAKQSQAEKQNKPLLKLIDKYYADLADFARQNVLFEMGTRHAFHRLLADAGKPHGWTLIAEQEKKVNGKTIRPDGTFKDEMNLVRGFWEAKDTADNLDKEIEKKRKAGYPLNNIIFEDTSTAVLYQHSERILTADMHDPAKLAELIVQFFRYVEPEIEEFEQAVDEFKERVPDLAEGLAKKIADAHRTNPQFKQAFADFFELCQTSLNPNIAQAAVDEMLIQHILTERLIREIFDNPEFVRRNVIAAEVEKVMLAMTSHSFDRNTYLRDLDRFYVAIEHAARTMTDWSDKQYFLNTVYERFFQGYSVKLADTMGIVYTPQEIVDFMCASVAEVLEQEFGKKLWSDDVYIIDPCTGTGNFIVNLIRRIPKAKLEDVYKHRLFANEIMLLPYYIAALNIEHAFFEEAAKYEAFEGLCFVDTLGLAEDEQANLSFMTEANTVRVQRQQAAPINIVIGNPPYNAHQESEHDDNRNRTYKVIDTRIRETYAKDSAARNKVALSDPYVKFFRWASDRIGTHGVVMFVSNNSFLEAVAFDGMRKHLARDFACIYTIDLKGNIRKDSMRDGIPLGEDHTVFGLGAMVGVSVTCLVKKPSTGGPDIYQASVHFRSTRQEKFAFLAAAKALSGIKWTKTVPDDRGTWTQAENATEFAKYVPIGSGSQRSSKTAARDVIFKQYSRGLETSRDSWIYSFSISELESRMEVFVETFNSELDRWKRSKRPDDLDRFVVNDEQKIKWTSSLKQYIRREQYVEFSTGRIRPATYRPFQQMFVYADLPLIHRPGLLSEVFPVGITGELNPLIALTDLGSEKPFMVLATNLPTDLHVVGAGSASQCFPFYVYDEDGTNRRENITDWALKQFREHYQDKKIDKWAIFYYVYGLLHHAGYREKFADNLKRELPRIPFAPALSLSPSPGTPGEGRGEGLGEHPGEGRHEGSSGFWGFSKAGQQLANLHLDYEQLEPWDLELVESPGVPLSYRVEDKMRLSKDKLRLTVNPSLTLYGIPLDAFNYRLGNRSALEWVIDQYQVSTDKRSGITSDPNRDDDPQYIVRLVGQVIRVSIETATIVNSLPAYSTENT